MRFLVLEFLRLFCGHWYLADSYGLFIYEGGGCFCLESFFYGLDFFSSRSYVRFRVRVRSRMSGMFACFLSCVVVILASADYGCSIVCAVRDYDMEPSMFYCSM